MRAFIVLCLIAVATADVSSLTGYNYQSGSSGGISGGFGGDGGSSHFGGVGGDGGSGHFGGISGDGGSAHFGGISGDGGSGQFGGDGGSGQFGGGISGGGFGGGDGGYEKEFYSFSSNDAEFDQPDASNQIANALKRNLQVVFIKGPENRGLENAALSLAKHAADQRTAIYVLNKQTDIGDLANRLNQANSHNRHKPEVHFVKYRTHEDAANAQRAIQSQYDQLGGSSQSHNGGVAPVLNFASASHVHAPAPQAPGSAYLPSSIFRRFRK